MDEQLIVARAIHFAATMAVAGVMMFSLCVAEPAFLAGGGTHRVAVTVRARLAWFAWISFTIALASGAAWLIILAQQLSDGTVTAVLRDGIVRIVLTRTSFGADWTVRFGLAVLLAAILPFRFARQTPWGRALAAVVAAGVAATLAFAGHAAAGPGVAGMVNLVSDILHLVAAAAWVGGLVPLALLLREAGRPVVGPEAGGRGLGKMDAAALDIAREATRRFSTLGVASVGILVATGIVNSWILVGSLSDLVETDYGRFLVAKVALFLVMVAVAAFNRSRLTPQLLTGDARIAAPDALRLLRRNSLIEAAIAAAVLAIVGMLGTLPPGMHETG